MEGGSDPVLEPVSGVRSTREKRDERRAIRAQEHGKRRLLTMGRWALGLAVAVAIIMALGWFVRQQQPTGADYSQAYPILGREHIDVGAAHEVYNSNPPTSGWHYAEAAPEGIYSTTQPDEQLIHNLEHGDVWISYKPTIPESVREELEAFANAWDKVIFEPREKNEADIALAAWGRLDTFNVSDGKLDNDRITNFIKRYQNTGPEQVPASAHVKE